VESWSDFGFGGAGDLDDTFWLNRFRYHGELNAFEFFRAFVEGKSAFSTDRDLPGGRRGLDVDELDLQNAFVEFKIPLGAEAGMLTLRPGRQELAFGKQRLVSPLDWANTRRTFDGVTAILDVGRWNITGFWSQFVPVRKYDFNEADGGTELFGVYAAGAVPGVPVGLDLYWLGLDRDASAVGGGFNSTAGREDRHTLGGRLHGRLPDSAFDYDLEGGYQLGQFGSADIDAFMAAAELGYTADSYGAPRLFVGFDYASGDDSPGGDVETFNQLFPLGHAHLGYIDIVGRQNIVDLRGGISVQPVARVTLALEGHYFQRADRDDAFYNAGGGVVRSGASGSSRELGGEIDVTIKYSFNRHLLAVGGYSHFFAGEFIEQSGPDDDIDFVYVMMIYTF
jgi:hypothetical protein